MRASTISLATVCAALALTTVHLWRDRGAERSRAEALELRLATLSQIPEPARRVAHDALQSANTGTSPRKHDASTGSSPDSLPAPPSSSAVDEYRDQERALLRDPKIYEAKRKARHLEKSAKVAEYQRLGLGLSPDEASKLVDSWVDVEMEALTKARPPQPRSDAERLALAEFHDRQQRQREEKLRAALGDATYEKYRDFMASRPIRNQVMSLSAQLGDGSNALRPEQFEPLVGALYAERMQLDRQLLDYVETDALGSDVSETGMQRSHEYMAELTAATHQRMHDRAAGILSPQQLAVLDAMLKSERDVERARNEVFRLEIQAQRAGG